MNKAQRAAQVAAELSLRKAAPDRLLPAVFSTIADALAREERLSIAGFGTIATRTCNPRTLQNPRTRESIDVAASTAPSFNAANNATKSLRDAINARAA